jgi:hypothetical protein
VDETLILLRGYSNFKDVQRRAPKIVGSVVFFTRFDTCRYELRPRSNRRLTGAVAGSLTGIGTRATVAPAPSPSLCRRF